jgi:acyl phosphate:glycerol-3-phosphate acyltransferase
MDFITNPVFIAIAVALGGYLTGSLSTARIVYLISTGSSDYAPFKEAVPHSDEVFESDLISATWVTKKLGKKYGCITSILDMIKVGLPTLLVKLFFVGHPYFLLTAICGIAGHNYPIYHRFKGGRGESPIIGSILVINWPGLFITNAAASILGYITGSILVLRWGAYILLIPWFWIWFNDYYYVVFMILANILFFYSMKNDLKRFRELKKSQGLAFSEEDVSEFIVMGKSPGRFLDKYGLYFVLKRLLGRKK